MRAPTFATVRSIPGVSAPVAAPGNETIGFITFPFGEPGVVLEEGHHYALVLKNEGSGTTSWIVNDGRGDPPYSGNIFWDIGSGWTMLSAWAGTDYYFRVYVDQTAVDGTPPELTLPANITAEATSAGGVVVNFTATAIDLVDGAVAVSCTPASGSTFPLGATTVTCTAADASGNAASGTFTVKVSYAWSDFLQPINTDGSSIFKLGGTVPVKFALTGASAGVANATAKFYVAKISNGIAGSEVEATSTSAATTGNLFRYDATSHQYVFNWGTKGLTVGTYRVRIDLGDGVDRFVYVSLK